MPSVSKAQQRLMGMAYALKKGDMERSEASQEVQDLADSMTLKQLKDYAETSHKGLPDKIEEYSLGSYYTGSFFWFTQAGQAAVQKISMLGDQKDPLVQKFIDFITKANNKDNKRINEGDYGAGIAANPSNVPGMGNAVPPSADQPGSGDLFGSGDEEDDPNRKVGLMSYEQYKKWVQKWQQQQKEKDQKAGA
jgi:hypothetical protein